MDEQWPSERRAKNSSFPVRRGGVAKNIMGFWDVLAEEKYEGLDNIVDWILDKNGDIYELEQYVIEIFHDNLSVGKDGQSMIMVLACAAALARAPSVQTWDKINAYKSNSVEIESWLSEAMMAYAEMNTSVKDAYGLLAQKVFNALDDFSLESKFDRVNKERVGALTGWNEGSERLDEIWWGLRGWQGPMSYESELPLFEVYYDIDPDGFISTVSRSKNPYLVSALLFVAGIGSIFPRFSEWRRMILAAPNAFELDGRWNGSVLIPLLLVEARSQLLHIGQEQRNLNLSPDELNGLKQEIFSIVELIANTLVERQDFVAIFVRWAPWLMRQIVAHASQGNADVRLSAFSDNALIDEIGRKIEGHVLPETVSNDASYWESWCYRCALASFANDGYAKTPDWEDFGDEWRLSPEDWIGGKGCLLRERAKVVTSLNNEIPGFAAHLLAYPMAQCSSPEEAWIGLWADTYVLREIVEFGDLDAVSDEYRSRSEAGRLLIMLFNIGLALFDQISDSCSDKNSSEARSAVALYMALDSAVSEMREIDNTLNHDKWLAIVQHMTVRRFIWASSSDYEGGSAKFQVFKPDDVPSPSDILIRERGDVFEMFAILQSLMLNNVPIKNLKTEMDSASVDVSSILQSIRTINGCNQRKYPINEDQLRGLEALI